MISPLAYNCHHNVFHTNCNPVIFYVFDREVPRNVISALHDQEKETKGPLCQRDGVHSPQDKTHLIYQIQKALEKRH